MPDEHKKGIQLLDPFKLTLLIFAIIAFMYFAGEVLKPLARSILLSFALAPGARLLEKIGVPRVAAVVLTVVITLGLLSGIGYVVGQQLTALANRLPDYQQNIETKLSRVIKPEQESTTDRLKNSGRTCDCQDGEDPVPWSRRRGSDPESRGRDSAVVPGTVPIVSWALPGDAGYC